MTAKDPALARAIEAFGGTASDLAKKIGVSPQALSQWRKIPLARVVDVERETGIPHEELRPDVFKPEVSPA